MKLKQKQKYLFYTLTSVAVIILLAVVLNMDFEGILGSVLGTQHTKEFTVETNKTYKNTPHNYTWYGDDSIGYINVYKYADSEISGVLYKYLDVYSPGTQKSYITAKFNLYINDVFINSTNITKQVKWTWDGTGGGYYSAYFVASIPRYEIHDGMGVMCCESDIKETEYTIEAIPGEYYRGSSKGFDVSIKLNKGVVSVTYNLPDKPEEVRCSNHQEYWCGTLCGNGECSNMETCNTCPSDCGPCPPPVTCGDNICDSNENCEICSSDCGACSSDESWHMKKYYGIELHNILIILLIIILLIYIITKKKQK